jgi:hypothetical protein
MLFYNLFANLTDVAISIFVAFLACFFTVRSFNEFHEHPENTTTKFYLLRILFAIIAFLLAFIITELLMSYLS